MSAPFLPNISICLIQHLVAEQFRVSVKVMTSPSRKREHARPRQMAMTLAIEFTSKSKTLIGRRFGGRDHSTVWYAERQIRNLVQRDTELRCDHAAVRAMLGQLQPREMPADQRQDGAPA